MTKPVRRWRKWLKRIGLVFLGLLLVLAIFHRPLIFEGTRYFVVRAARQQHLDLTYDIHGSIFSTLTISNLHATPTERGPIQRLEVGSINLQYSLWDLFHKGLPALLKVVDVRDVYVEITPGQPVPPAEAEKPQQLKFPALFPELLNLANVNFISHAPGGDTTLEGLWFCLLPDRPGVLKIKNLDIPGVRRWQGISGTTTFRDRNLRLTNLVIGPEIALRQFNLDASHLDEAVVAVALDGKFFQAPTNLALRITDLNASNHLSLQMTCANLDFDAVWKYLNLPAPVHGTLKSLSAKFEGEPEQPNHWTGDVAVQLDKLVVPPQAIGATSLDVVLRDGRAVVDLRQQFDSKNHLLLHTEAALPEKLADFKNADVTGRLELAVPELATLTHTMAQPIQGDLSTVTNFQLHHDHVTSETLITSDRLSASGAELAKTHFDLHAEKDLASKPGAPPFAGLATKLDGTVASLHFQSYAADTFAVALETKDALITLQNLSIAKGRNSVRIKAAYTLPDDLQSFAKQALKLDLSVAAPELQAFVLPNSGTSLKGALNVTGQATVAGGVYNGDFQITGRGIDAQGLTVRTIDGRLQILNSVAHLSALDVVLDDKNSIHAGGKVELATPFTYDGNLDIRLTDLSRFQPLLGPGKGAPVVGGSLAVTWQGTGTTQVIQQSGSARIDLTGGKFGDRQGLTAHVSADYSPDYVNVPDLRISAGPLGEAAVSLFWRDNRLHLTNLLVRQQKLTLLEGSLELPFFLAQARNPDLLLPGDQPLSLSLRTHNLDLRSLLTQLGQKPAPLTGTVNLDVEASGTLDTLAATTSLKATRLQSTSASEFAPADLDIELGIRDRRLTLNGTVQQRLIQPLKITGSLPLDITALRKKPSLDPATPLDFQVSLPPSSLAFVSTLVPAVRQSRGTASVDVRVSGTVGKPTIQGSITGNLDTLRFTDPSLPPLDRFLLRVAFTPDRLRIDQCQGGIAGGVFRASGGISYANPQNPIFDLRLGTRDALVMQNDDLTVRVSSDLRIAGPLKAGTVSGTVYVTKSRFFKDIDILPIGLPGRPAPQPPAEPDVISFRNPPLRDWKFDVAIKTNDPFLVQSNLANGRITMDLKLGGTGLDPWMDGSVRIERLTASLPFSRLQIDSGLIYFTRDAPFVPHLNIRGTSAVQDYTVNVYIYGVATNPQAVFSSNPPLPQADVISLLATGVTTNALSRDPNALAGRAALLVFQQLYQKLFPRKGPPPDHESFLSRIQFDVGVADPKTGQQSALARIPLTDQLALVGGVDVGGNFRGQVKYLIRFK